MSKTFLHWLDVILIKRAKNEFYVVCVFVCMLKENFTGFLLVLILYIITMPHFISGSQSLLSLSGKRIYPLFCFVVRITLRMI